MDIYPRRRALRSTDGPIDRHSACACDGHLDCGLVADQSGPQPPPDSISLHSHSYGVLCATDLVAMGHAPAKIRLVARRVASLIQFTAYGKERQRAGIGKRHV